MSQYRFPRQSEVRSREVGVVQLRTAVRGWLVWDENGASMVEYALLVALIALVVTAGALFFGTEISDKLSDVGTTLENS